MLLNPHHISLATKTWSPIHRDSYVSTVDIDILYGDGLKKIGEGKVYQARMDRIVNEGVCSFFVVFDGHSSDLSSLYDELFADDELVPGVDEELCDYSNIALIKSILLMPEYRGQGLGGILALAIADMFDERDIVALRKPSRKRLPESFTKPIRMPDLSRSSRGVHTFSSHICVIRR